MRHRMDSRSLGRYGSHRMAMLSNMAASLFLEENITTTLIRAKELRRFAERLITRAKGGTIHDRRERKEIREPSGRLHPYRQNRVPRGRQRFHGGHIPGGVMTSVL